MDRFVDETPAGGLRETTEAQVYTLRQEVQTQRLPVASREQRSQARVKGLTTSKLSPFASKGIERTLPTVSASSNRFSTPFLAIFVFNIPQMIGTSCLIFFFLIYFRISDMVSSRLAYFHGGTPLILYHRYEIQRLRQQL